MPPRKERIAVVFDTNVLIAFYLSHTNDSAVAKMIRSWRNERKLQMIVCDQVIAEYLEILERLNVNRIRINRLKYLIETLGTVSRVSLGERPAISRDPKDNLFLATALAGRAGFLITLDKDLLEISESEKKKFKFQIMTPAAFLKATGD